MKTQLQVVEASPYRPYQPVLHHDTREDFTVYQTAGMIPRWYALALDLALSTPLNVLIHLPFRRYLERMQAYGQDARYWVL